MYERHSKNRNGYVSTVTVYECESCQGCSYKEKCIHGNNCKTSMEERNKRLNVSKVMININDGGTKRAVRLESIPNVFPMTEENIVCVSYNVPSDVTVWSDEEDVIDSFELTFSGLDDNSNQIIQTITNP